MHTDQGTLRAGNLHCGDDLCVGQLDIIRGEYFDRPVACRDKLRQIGIKIRDICVRHRHMKCIVDHRAAGCARAVICNGIG